jgi:hypothetical protein
MAVSALAGVGVPLIAWSVLVPWNLSSASAADRAPPRMAAAVVATAILGGAIAALNRPAGRSFVLAAYVMTLFLFSWRAVTSRDPLWPMALLLFMVVALGAFVLAFALARFLRTGSPMG